MFLLGIELGIRAERINSHFPHDKKNFLFFPFLFKFFKVFRRIII